jgi:hypothetical protein
MLRPYAFHPYDPGGTPAVSSRRPGLAARAGCETACVAPMGSIRMTAWNGNVRRPACRGGFQTRPYTHRRPAEAVEDLPEFRRGDACVAPTRAIQMLTGGRDGTNGA